MTNEYLTSNEYIAFPFRDHAEGLYEFGDSPDYVTPSFPRNGLTDAVITYYGGHQVYLRTVEKSGTTIDFSFGTDSDILVVASADLNDLVDRFVVTGRNLSLEVSLKFVVGSGLYDYLNGALDGTLDFGLSLPLADHVMDAKPYKVTDFRVKGESGIKGIVDFMPGYNFEIEYFEDINEILMSVVPGGGEGRFDPCAEEVAEPVDFVASINGKRAADGGSMILGGSGQCYRVVASGNGFQIINDCKPCCECEDYEAIAIYLAKLNQELIFPTRAKLLGLPDEPDQVNLGMIKKFNDDVTYFHTSVLPRMTNLRIYGSGRQGHSLNNDKYAYLTVNFHSPATNKSVNYSIVINGEYILEDSWMTVNDSTGGGGLVGGVGIEKNQVAVLTLLIKKKPIFDGFGNIIGYHPLPGSATVTASWTGDRGIDPECDYIPTSGSLVVTIGIG